MVVAVADKKVSKVDGKELFDSVEAIERMADADTYERVGSIVWWEVKGRIDLEFKEAQAVFKGSLLEPFLSPVLLCHALMAFKDKVIAKHYTTYGKKLQCLQQTADSGYYYLVFYTGKVESQDDAAKFSEHAKYLIGENGEYLALLNKDDKFQLNFDASATLLEKSFNITHVQVQQMLRDLCNVYGYRFSFHGGHYFLPHRYSQNLYDLKKIISQFSQKLAISPVICGTEEDAEEIISIIGDGFKADILEAKRELFEVCLKAYGFQIQWDDYKKAVLARDFDKLKASAIAQKTRYGIELTRKLEIINDNACDEEYNLIIRDWVNNVKPSKNNSNKLFRVKEKFQKNIAKLSACNDSKLIQKHISSLMEEMYQLNQTLKKVSQDTMEEVLSIL